MDKLLIMAVLTVVGGFGALFYSPFLGVSVYYLFASIRPQHLWNWVLPKGVRWSFYVAVPTLIAIALLRLGANRPALAVSNDEEEAPPFRIGSGLLVLFFSWQCLSYLGALDTKAAAWLINEFVPIVLMFVASSLYLTRSRQLWILTALATGSLCYLSYDVNFKYLAWGRLDIFHIGYGGFDNNGAALMIAMGMPACYFMWEGGTSRFRLIWIAFIPVIIHAVMLTYSRGAMLSLVLVLPLIALRARRKKWIIVGTVALVIGVPILAGDEIRQRFFSIEDSETDGSAQGRLVAWRAATAIATDHPVFGVGPRNSPRVIHQYGDVKAGMAVHSTYFQFAADVGFCGLVIYLALVARFYLACRRVRRVCRRQSDPEAIRLLATAGAVETSFTVFAVGSAFLSLEVFELPYFMMMIGYQLEWVSGRWAEKNPRALSATGAEAPASRTESVPDLKPV